MTIINWVFVRHGFGCHNALGSLIQNEIVSQDEGRELSQEFVDPQLTPLGVEASLNNGCVISSVIKSMGKITNKPDYNIDSIDIVGCSPLIRSMQTAFYMTRNWKTPPKRIYVLPHLRELDEGSSDKYSSTSLKRIETIPSYAMKDLNEQKKVLQEEGILQYFDFSFVEIFSQERKAPGDIGKFMVWFVKNIALKSNDGKNLNVFIVTHAGVLKDFSSKGFVNNSGFMVHSKYEKPHLDFEIVHFDKYLPKSFFANYLDKEYVQNKYYCPSSRCGTLCAKISPKNSFFDKFRRKTESDISPNTSTLSEQFSACSIKNEERL